MVDGWLLDIYPDYDDAPATTYTARIINTDAPLQKMFPHWDIYEGSLIIKEA